MSSVRTPLLLKFLPVISEAGSSERASEARNKSCGRSERMLKALVASCLASASFALVVPRAVASASVRVPARVRVPALMTAGREEDSSYSVDWDAAWRAELSKRAAGTHAWRPEGHEPVRAVATDAAQTEVERYLRADDWRFWMSIIASLAVSSAIATAYNSPASYLA